MPAIRIFPKLRSLIPLEEAMKYVTAFVVALSLLSGPVSANTVWDQVSDTAPRSGVFDDLDRIAPKGLFETLNDTTPRSDGVFGEVEKNAP
jgi:hypothetical protein